jgi:hypothetical protein
MSLLRALRCVRRRHLVVPAAVAAIVLTASMPACADEVWTSTPAPALAPAAPTSTPPAMPAGRDDSGRARRWYGWQPLLTDGLSLSIVPVLAASTGQDSGGPVVGFAVASYLLAAPIVHLAHGRAGIAAASLGLRLGLPTAGFFLGAVAAPRSIDGRCCGIESAAIGTLVGVIAASAIDAAALSWDHPSSDDGRGLDEARQSSPRKKLVTLTPVGGPRREGGFDVGVGAIF